MIFLKHPDVGGGVDLLDPSLWQMVGWHSGRASISRPGGTGPLILAHDGVSAAADQVGMALIGSSYTDVTVEVEMVTKGWNFATFGDTVCGGPACRLSGTVASANWNGYFCAQRLFNTTSRRASNRKFVAGATNAFGTETVTMTAAYFDQSTHVIAQVSAAGATQQLRQKLLGDSTWLHDQAGADATVAAAGMVGIFCHKLQVSMSIEVHAITIT